MAAAMPPSSPPVWKIKSLHKLCDNICSFEISRWNSLRVTLRILCVCIVEFVECQFEIHASVRIFIVSVGILIASVRMFSVSVRFFSESVQMFSESVQMFSESVQMFSACIGLLFMRS